MGDILSNCNVGKGYADQGFSLVKCPVMVLGICELRFFLGKFFSHDTWDHAVVASPCADSYQFRQGVGTYMYTRRPYGVARGGARSRVLAPFRAWEDDSAFAEKLGARAIWEFWCGFWVPGILKFGKFFGGPPHGRKPHGGSERPRIKPPLTFLRGGGPRPLG